MAVQQIGYTSLDGASATALASLKQYGLTVDAGKGMLKLTPLALDIIEPESETGRGNALVSAAFKPGLFDALRERFPDTTPSEGNLRAHLLRQQFTSAAVKMIVPAYLETCEYIAHLDESERSGQVPEIVSESPELVQPESSQMTAPRSPQMTDEMITPAPTTSKGRRMVFDTEEGEVIFTYPDSLSEESVQDIEEWFALVTKRLRRATKH